MNQDKFKLARDRDAYFVIRGYVYQVALTIREWLSLKEGQVLELEAGEDIDIVNTARARDHRGRRILGQVKHLSGGLTLNSEESRVSVANFAEHLLHNPGVDLRFRFLTSAAISSERHPKFKGVEPITGGLEAWRRASDDATASGERVRLLAAIKDHLRRQKRPDGLPVSTWQRYQEVLLGPVERFARMVCSFEWCAGVGDVPQVRQEVEARIQDLAVTEPGRSRPTTVVYDALFAHVFELLCQKGRKWLGVESREKLLAEPRLSAEQEALLAFLHGRLEAVEDQVAGLRRQVAEIETVLDTRDAPSIQLGVRGSAAPTSPPPSPARRGKRPNALRVVKEAIAASVWTSVYGVSGSGKTELVRDAASRSALRVLWLSLRGSSAALATETLVRTLVSLTGHDVAGDRGGWYAKVWDSLPGSVLVLDDLPLAEEAHRLEDELAFLARGLSGGTSRVVSTSGSQPSTRLRALLADDFASLRAPAFSDDEVVSLLQSYEAPEQILAPRIVSFVNAQARGNAELLVTSVRYLKAVEWRFSETEFAALLRGQPHEDVRRSAIRRVRATVGDPAARELLFRMAVSRTPPTHEIVELLSNIEPVLTRPGERLLDLLGLWVQPISEGRYQLCPLVTELDMELPREVRESANLRLGSAILADDSLGPNDAISAILHLLAGKDFERAGLVYCHSMTALRDYERSPERETVGPPYDAGLPEMWRSVVMPPEMSLGLRIWARSLQAGVFEARATPVPPLVVERMLSLGDEAGKDQVAACLPLLSRIPELSKRDFATTLRIVSAVLKRASLDASKHRAIPADVRTDWALWHLGTHAGSLADLKLWLAEFRNLDTKTANMMVTSPQAADAALAIAEKAPLLANRDRAEERRWETAVQFLDDLESAALDRGCVPLRWASRRARAVVLSDGLQTPERAIEVLREGITEIQSPGPDAMLLSDALGRILLSLGRAKEAEKALDPVTRQYGQHAPYQLVQLHGMLTLAEAKSRSSIDAAVVIARRAVGLAADGVDIPASERARALCELGVCCWLANDRAQAAVSFASALEFLVPNLRASRTTRALLVALGHTTGYFGSLAHAGHPPERTTDGGVYTRPTVGLFLRIGLDLAAQLREAHVAFVSAHIASIFVGSQLDDEGIAWATNAWRRSAHDDAFHIRELVAPIALVGELEAGSADATLETSLRFEHPIPVAIAGLTVALRLSFLSLADAGGARELASACAQVLRSRPTSGAAGPTTRVLADLMSILDRDEPFEEVEDAVAELDSEDGLVRCSLFAIQSLDPRASVVSNLRRHMLVTDTLIRMGVQLGPAFRRFWLPFLARYWKARVENERYRFRMPRLVLEEIEASMSSPSDTCAGEVLASVVQGLGISVVGAPKWLTDVRKTQD